ncbi:BCL2/adenovirus E1B 19 kDa protein-interacting protein 3 isoform X1 [Falco peregrinus]|uniref:BCL2/adenovirus E1B 19 kDa protein-interacting protein 3 isoform X1 n=1 Tax=Falco peregrinus TaxID=8954 RepID=UPI00247A278C|nr:BCL2/adenovirus E1B 19 kDa protein-interacting protein 3 isoform X1 [Falco peregrinus]
MRAGQPLTTERLGAREGGWSVSWWPEAAAAVGPGLSLCRGGRKSGGRAMSRLSPQEENLQGSWVELHFSSNGNGSGSTGTLTSQEQVPASISIHNGDMEKILLDAQHESGRSSSRESSHCDSPPRSQTPQDSHRALEIESHSSGEKNSFQSEEDFLERRKEVERLLKKNADWIWDWSSRPENIPPKEFLFKHPRRTATLSMRNTSVMKKGGIFSAEFLKVFLPSLLLSHLLAIGLGIYIGRRLTTTASSSTF